MIHADVERTQTFPTKSALKTKTAATSSHASSPVAGTSAPSTSLPEKPSQEEEELFMPSDDETEFYKIVNDDDEMLENAQALETDHPMLTLMDVLQCNGVAPEVASNFAASLVTNKPRFHALHRRLLRAQQFIHALTDRSPTFMELYGRGAILEASHGCRRNLNISGLDALDLRTCKKDGTPWDFNKSSDRRLAREMVESQKPTWIVGSPPCTAFCQLNLGTNYAHMDPKEVKRRVDEGMVHLTFMAKVYRKQMARGTFPP